MRRWLSRVMVSVGLLLLGGSGVYLGAAAVASYQASQFTGSENLTLTVSSLFDTSKDVRTFAARALRNKGYTVLEANSGESALALLNKQSAPIDLLISDEEMARRKAAWKAPAPKFQRGYGTLYLKHIQQADKGCDFDFLLPEGAAPEGEPEIH